MSIKLIETTTIMLIEQFEFDLEHFLPRTFSKLLPYSVEPKTCASIIIYILRNNKCSVSQIT